jgi:hypothetical protein
MDTDGDTVIAWNSNGQDGSGDGIYAQRFTNRNIAPSFTPGADVAVGVNAGPQTVPNWATGITAGPADESDQTVNFEIVANSNPSLFSTLPAVSSAGTLTYTPAANLYGSATVQVRLHDDGGTANGGADTSALHTFTISVLPPPQVLSVRVNDGTIQRSRVSNLTFTLSSPVTFNGSPTSIVQLSRVNGGPVFLGITISVVNDETVVALNFSGPETAFGSLRDGQYVLTVVATQIVDPAGQTLVGNSGSGATFTYQFHRLFGDADGSGLVDSTDFLAFRLAFLSTNPNFDSDGDGIVGPADFLQFRLRFLQSV